MNAPKLTALDFSKKSLDFLIIGGGTAGLVVAARLAENPELTIGVLEAGSDTLGENEDAINIPGLYGNTLGGSCDWNFETIPQEGLGGRVLQWPRGKVLGGTSALNFMTWNRGSREDYDAWAELGNPGWGWDDLLPFFKKSETFHRPISNTQIRAKASFDPEAVGSNGPIQVSFPEQYSQSHELWHPTLNSLGVETNSSHLSGSNVGVWTSGCSVNPSNCIRSYSASTYYKASPSRTNLFVLTEAVVMNILLDQEGEEWTAKGVHFEHGGVEYDVFASRETIISAGSVQSPQLLELSGIGSAEILSRAGIEVKVDNPNVGENLQDHLMTMMVFEVDPELANPDDLKTDPKLANAAREEYVSNNSGPLTILPCSICYLSFSHFAPPEFLSLLASMSHVTPFSERDNILSMRLSHPNNLGQIEYIFDLGNWSSLFQPDPSDGKKYGTMLQMLQYPFSRGKIHITSEPGKPATVIDKLAIDPEYYAGRNGRIDIEAMAQCQVFALKICATKPLANILRARVFPPPSVYGDELREWIVKTTVTDWHPVGTCAMSGRGIKTGVVDERLKVHGVRGLRVVDASIMPLQISAHLQATVYAIAEKAAHMIMQDIEG